MFQYLIVSLLFALPLIFIIFISYNSIHRTSASTSASTFGPRSYPLVGSTLALVANRHRLNQWISEILSHSPNGTYVLHRALGARQVITANPSNVQHILKTRFSIYPKGDIFTTTLADLLGNGIVNADGDSWKFQRQISSHEFNTKSLCKFITTVVDTELANRLIPFFSQAVAKNVVLDLQDILQRFAFDNICSVALGFDPECLSPSLPQTELAVAFEDAIMISGDRFNYPLSVIWKLKRLLNIGLENQLKQAASRIRDYAQNVVTEKKQELKENQTLETNDLLSRILKSGNVDDRLAIDMVISFVIAGRDTTSAALTWFFWLISCNSHVEKKILDEIMENPNASSTYEETKEMVYTHASLCESMRLYPPVPWETKQAAENDVLPDGTVIKKGMKVEFHPYSMGRMESLWGKDWAEFKPERWLERNETDGKLSFVGRDPFMYPVFQAGPRICLGKEMAFLQMKRVVAGVLRGFRVIPAAEEGFQPVYVSYITAKMKGGFPVRIVERGSKNSE